MPTDAERAVYREKHYGLRESDVEGKAGEYAKKLGGWHTKFKSSNNRGLPDRQFKHAYCREFYIEFKKPRRKARTQQKLKIDEMREHGFLVFVTDNLEIAKKIIFEMFTFGETDADS